LAEFNGIFGLQFDLKHCCGCCFF